MPRQLTHVLAFCFVVVVTWSAGCARQSNHVPRSTDAPAPDDALVVARETPATIPTAVASAPATAPANLVVPASVESLERRLAEDPQLFAREDKDGQTVLHLAAQRGDVEVVRRMLDLGADVNVRASKGVGATPLMSLAAGMWNDQIRRGTRPPDDVGPVEWSAAKSRQRIDETRGQKDPRYGPMEFESAFRLLLERGADVKVVVKERRKSEYPGTTALQLFAMVDQTSMVETLLKAGADPTVTSEGWGSPLTAAATFGNKVAVRALLAAGVDVNGGDERDRRMRGVRACSHPEVLTMLLDAGMEVRPELIRSASGRLGNPEALKILLDRQARGGPAGAVAVGADKAKLGDALYRAAKEHADGDPEKLRKAAESVKLLLDAGAPADAPDGTGEALVAAVCYGNEPVARLLRERGVKVDWARLKDHEHNAHFQAFACLITNKPDRLRELESLGMPLDLTGAAMLGREELVRKQLAALPPGDGREPNFTLYAAAGYGHEQVVRMLLDAGFDANAKTPGFDNPDTGGLPLEAAAVRGHANVVKLLLERGADPKRLDFDAEDLAELKPEIRALLRPRPASRGR